MKMLENSRRVSTTARVLVLCAVIFAQNYLSSELSSPFIVLLGLSIMSLGKIQRSYRKLVWPLLAVLIIGFIGISSHESRDILRDIAYALEPIALIFMGYWIAGNRDTWPLILKIVVIFGFAFACIHLSAFLLNPALLNEDVSDIRNTVGGTGNLVVLAIVLGVLQKHLRIHNLFPKYLSRFIALPVLSISFVLSYSRTEFVTAIILFLALLGLLSKLNSRMIFTISILVVGFFVIAWTTPKDEDGTFRSKLVRSFTEVSVSNYQDAQDINDNWRGFETYRVLVSFSSGNQLQQLFGQGFGALVDLGLYMPLGGEDLRYIPIFHNGYAYILIKTGILGLACYVLFYISLIRIAIRDTNSLISELRFSARLLLGIVLSLAFSMFVVGGMAEIHDSVLVLLLGYMARRIWQMQSENRRIVAEEYI